MPAGLERGQLAPRRRDAARARRIGEGDHAVGVADVECVADQRHAEWLVQPVEEHIADLGDAVAVRVAEKRDAVRARTDGGGALDRAEHGVVEKGLDRHGLHQRLGDQHFAARQHMDPARVLEAARKRIDLEPRGGGRRLPLRPPFRGRHLEGRKCPAASPAGSRDWRRSSAGALPATAGTRLPSRRPVRPTVRLRQTRPLQLSPRASPTLARINLRWNRPASGR